MGPSDVGGVKNLGVEDDALARGPSMDCGELALSSLAHGIDLLLTGSTSSPVSDINLFFIVYSCSFYLVCIWSTTLEFVCVLTCPHWIRLILLCMLMYIYPLSLSCIYFLIQTFLGVTLYCVASYVSSMMHLTMARQWIVINWRSPLLHMAWTRLDLHVFL